MNITTSKEISLDQIKAEEIEFNIMVKRSDILAKSSLLPASLRNKPSDVLVIMMMARELDIPPLQALNGINVIQGKPVVSPQLMIALIRSKVPNSFVEIIESDNKCVCSMCRDKSDKDQIYTSTWTLERAEKMGLATKDNWRKQASTMLKWRSVGDCARTVFPDILSGLYFPDEFQDGTLDINEHGELIGKRKQETVTTTTTVIAAPPVENKLSTSYHEFISKLSFITNKFQDKPRLEEILNSFGVKSSKELAGLEENQLMDMCAKLDEFKGMSAEQIWVNTP